MWNHIRIIRVVKEHIPFGIKILLIRCLVFFQSVFYYCFPQKREWKYEKKIFVLLSTDYSNLGDHAMTYAQMQMLEKNFPEYKVYEVLVGDTIKCFYTIKKYLMPGDIITLKGGGNVGMEYFREELIRRKIVKTFINNKVVMFPQTVYFPDTRQGRREFRKTIDVFNSNENFIAYFRDKKSFDLVNPYLRIKRFLVPDIVFYLGHMKEYLKKKHGAVTCLRRDVEGIYTEDDKRIILDVLKSIYGKDVIVTDTIKDYKITKGDRFNELKDMWITIANAELIVTDRLHGMIFAALLGTPCIVLNTYNHKLHGQYEWISDLEYIECIDFSRENLEKTMKHIVNTKHNIWDSSRFNSYYMNMIQTIRE